MLLNLINIYHITMKSLFKIGKWTYGETREDAREGFLMQIRKWWSLDGINISMLCWFLSSIFKRKSLLDRHIKIWLKNSTYFDQLDCSYLVLCPCLSSLSISSLIIHHTLSIYVTRVCTSSGSRQVRFAAIPKK